MLGQRLRQARVGRRVVVVRAWLLARATAARAGSLAGRPNPAPRPLPVLPSSCWIDRTRLPGSPPCCCHLSLPACWWARRAGMTEVGTCRAGRASACTSWWLRPRSRSRCLLPPVRPVAPSSDAHPPSLPGRRQHTPLPALFAPSLSLPRPDGQHRLVALCQPTLGPSLPARRSEARADSPSFPRPRITC